MIADFLTYMLFDSGAVHSFISSSFIAKSSIACDKFDSILEVSIPLCRVLSIDKITKLVQMKLKGRAFEARLFVIDIIIFDIILGVDWLGCNNATIRCREN